MSQKKYATKFFHHNFSKYYPIFKLLLAHSSENLQ